MSEMQVAIVTGDSGGIGFGTAVIQSGSSAFAVVGGSRVEGEAERDRA